ncbi:MAG: AI-2E family transporter [Pseudomonadota bacterium]
MTVGEQLRWWGLGFLAAIALLWIFADPLLPFIMGMIIAYLADPVADRLERLGMSRLSATIALSVTLAGVAFLIAMLLVPAIIEQVRDLISRAPEHARMAQETLSRLVPEIQDEGSLFQSMIGVLQGRAEAWSVRVLEQVWVGGLALIDLVTIAVITPVVAFYLLFDWNTLLRALDDLAPRQHQALVRRLALELDDVLAGFVRGQMTVCFLLGGFYAVALMAVGLQYGLLVGMFAGVISFIPFIGSVLGGVISIGIAVGQFWNEPGSILAVAVIFVIGQVVEGNYLTPKLVGGHVKLHPVWLMLALSVFGFAMGFVGLLIAVPAAAMIGVFARFLVEQYRQGRLYRGDPAWRAAAARQAAQQEAAAAVAAKAAAAAESAVTPAGASESASGGSKEGASGGSKVGASGGSKAGAADGSKGGASGGSKAGASGGSKAGAAGGSKRGASRGSKAGASGGSKGGASGGTGGADGGPGSTA